MSARTEMPRRATGNPAPMILLLDIGNTHTHAALSDGRGLRRQVDLPTAGWFDRRLESALTRFLRGAELEGVSLASVVPRATRRVRDWVRRHGRPPLLELTAARVRGLGVDYPRPRTIGPDRLANAIAARARFGAPVLVVDFGTAVTFDVVDARGNYVGGIITPGLAAMTDYLHEKTALLPRIAIRPVRRMVGRSTAEAMRIGAVEGYRGLVRCLIRGLRRELGVRRLPVVATGGYAGLLARGVPEIGVVEPNLTLDGLRRFWELHTAGPRPRASRGVQRTARGRTK